MRRHNVGSQRTDGCRGGAVPVWERGLFGVFLALAVFGLFAASAGAQETGRIVGRVTATESGAPISAAQVFLPGVQLGSLSRLNGSYLILQVPAGTHEVRVERIGLTTVTRQVTVTAGGVVEVNFQMATEALGLDEIVVTGTAGAARRREVGNTIAQINMAELPQRPRRVADMLGAVPGLQFTGSGGAMGTGGTIRLRGNSTVSMSNQPIIYIDGIRMQSKPFPPARSPAIRTTSQGAMVEVSPLNSINPNDIERIEVIKGSAATTLYGTEASAGVIQIFTKRGSAGGAVWNMETQQTARRAMKLGTDRHPYMRWDYFLKTGHMQKYTASVRGGGEDLQYFTSVQMDRGTGILPSDTIGIYSLRGNFTFTPAENLQIQYNTAYFRQTQRNSDLSPDGFTYNLYRGIANYWSSEDPAVLEEIQDMEVRQGIERFTTGVMLTYSPLANLTNRLSIGYDVSQQEVRNHRPFGYTLYPQGSVFNDTWSNRILTVDYVGTSVFNVMEGLRLSFSWGGQAVGEEIRHLQGFGDGFPGAANPTVSSAAIRTAFEDRSKVWNAGFFFQNVFDIADRYFVTMGMRVDGNSTFGSGFGLQKYPKASLSWVISDEGFWQDGWGSVKLRAAYGQSGRAPGAFDAVRTWTSTGLGPRPAIIPANVGSDDLGPEVTAEIEGGLDGEWLDGRLSATVTYYKQTTSDALFNVAQVPTEGFGGTQLKNVGTISNKGLEVGLNASPIRGANWGWDVGMNLTTNTSEVVDLGGIPAFSIGSGGWMIEGQPVPVMRGRGVRNTGNERGTGPAVGKPLNSCSAGTSEPCIDNNFIYGPNQPTLTWSPTTTLRMPAGISVSTRGEFRGGHYMIDGMTGSSVGRSAWMPQCWDYYVSPYDGATENYAPPDPARHTLELKAETPAFKVAQCTPATTHNMLSTRKADFFRLRDVNAQIPVNFAFPNRVNDAILTLSLNNYWSWYNGEWEVMDPDMSRGTQGRGLDDTVVDGPTINFPPTSWSMSASLRVQF